VLTATHSFLTSLPGAVERLELCPADLLTAGSFDTAVTGCNTVIHTASPFVLDVKDPQHDLVEPAVDSTLNVLRSARSAGVRRVVLTSSIAAVSDEPVEGEVFTEKDWNEQSTLARTRTISQKPARSGLPGSLRGTEDSTLDPVHGISPDGRHRPRDGAVRGLNPRWGAHPGRLAVRNAGARRAAIGVRHHPPRVDPWSGIPVVHMMGAGLVGGRIANSTGVSFWSGRSSRSA
jgi:3-beta hydroxysteroid dehydrogenase/isomerase family